MSFNEMALQWAEQAQDLSDEDALKSFAELMYNACREGVYFPSAWDAVKRIAQEYE